MSEQDRTLLAQQTTVSYSGPIPPPESLEKYDKVVPGSAQTIIDMAVKEQEHRHDIEGKQTKDYKTLMIISSVFSGVVSLAFIGAIIYAIYKDVDAYAVALMIVSVGAVVGWVSIKKKNK